MGIILSQVNVYPVKSVAGISLSHAWAQRMGLSFDRRFMVANMDGLFITGRTHPIMSEIQVSLQSNGITLDHPSVSPLMLKYVDFCMEEISTNVFNDAFNAFSTTTLANAWFSHLLGGDKQLLFIGENTSERVIEKTKEVLSFADGSPLLLVNLASLEALNARSVETHHMAQFRGNVVISGGEAFEEDTWAKIRIGSVIFTVDSPCSRCIFTTLDLAKGRFRKNGEPLSTLSQFRTDEKGQVNFGMNLSVLVEGMLKVGDALEVLEFRDPPGYQEESKKAVKAVARLTDEHELKNVSISIDGVSFRGNDKQVLLLQAEDADIPLNFGCRVGRCGCCKLRLLEGEVDHQQDVPGLSMKEKESGIILACSCVPKTPLILSTL